MNPILQTMRNANQTTRLLHELKRGNPQQIFQQMMQTNPQFRQFVSENQGLPIEQIASKYGVDMDAVKQFLR